jgi:hypothetical protein
VSSSHSRPSGNGSPPGAAAGSLACSSGMENPLNLMPSSASSRDVSHSMHCTRSFLRRSTEGTCQLQKRREEQSKARSKKGGPLRRRGVLRCHARKRGEGGGARALPTMVLTGMPRMPPMACSTVTSPSLLAPNSFFRALSFSCGAGGEGRGRGDAQAGRRFARVWAAISPLNTQETPCLQFGDAVLVLRQMRVSHLLGRDLFRQGCLQVSIVGKQPQDDLGIPHPDLSIFDESRRHLRKGGR